MRASTPFFVAHPSAGPPLIILSLGAAAYIVARKARWESEDQLWQGDFILATSAMCFYLVALATAMLRSSG